MAVKITFSFIILCLKSLQAAIKALCENGDDQSKIHPIHRCRNLLIILMLTDAICILNSELSSSFSHKPSIAICDDFIIIIY